MYCYGCGGHHCLCLMALALLQDHFCILIRLEEEEEERILARRGERRGWVRGGEGEEKEREREREKEEW